MCPQKKCMLPSEALDNDVAFENHIAMIVGLEVEDPLDDFLEESDFEPNDFMLESDLCDSDSDNDSDNECDCKIL